MTGHTRTIAVTGILFFIIGFSPLAAQNRQPADSTIYLLQTVQHESYRGHILQRTSDTLQFRTTGGAMITLPLSQVFALSPASDSRRDAAYDAAEPIARRSVRTHPATSLFISPTAYPIPSGEVHLGLYEIIVGSASAGLADLVEVSGGASLLPGMKFRPYYAGVKISPLRGDAGALAIGTIFTDDGNDEHLMYYGVGTIAAFDGWITAGYSFGSKEGEGIATIGADYPVSDVTRLMSELWFPVEGSDVLLCIGARFELEFMSVDIGCYVPLTRQSGDYLQYLPWLGGTFIL